MAPMSNPPIDFHAILRGLQQVAGCVGAGRQRIARLADSATFARTLSIGNTRREQRPAKSTEMTR